MVVAIAIKLNASS